MPDLEAASRRAADLHDPEPIIEKTDNGGAHKRGDRKKRFSAIDEIEISPKASEKMVHDVEDERHKNYRRPDDDAARGRRPRLRFMQAVEHRGLGFLAKLFPEMII